ncbi:cell division regulator GpsB [Aerococcaceae bacterium NML191292]|nr:cell division regulator GpsB [Aerococcaceae bacterium NML210727]MCW6654657.1 cell division regulator GpsB [Aerococcaceae bacterium NML201296]MCW6658903.1 cell division regulator GpsB [Aerococcaceae bacterium NML191292]MCW6660667.1 cell division regulator GpsB [Aerococcaceae bacterium NML201209]MCW6663369.1 cell division regulator GpsB [Aerococcaceae bacterium NML190073]MCW6664686.1 cell division regulator GpsB [Aerococcaceae bacterium NML191219]MCW6666670.1 cell division regulator GpsB [Ae
MAEKNLTAKDILQKEFTKGIRGYNTAEVDEYLDLIIRDYDSYQKEVAHLRTENDRLMSKVDELTKQLNLAKKSAPTTPGSGVTNFDILKRLSNLEKHVFGSKISNTDNTIDYSEVTKF